MVILIYKFYSIVVFEKKKDFTKNIIHGNVRLYDWTEILGLCLFYCGVENISINPVLGDYKILTVQLNGTHRINVSVNIRRKMINYNILFILMWLYNILYNHWNIETVF